MRGLLRDKGEFIAICTKKLYNKNHMEKEQKEQSLSNIREGRIEKLNKIIGKNINPFPSQVARTHTYIEIILGFEELAKKETKIVVGGRIRSLRLHGGSCFGHLEDGTGQIQLYFKKDVLKDNYEFLKDLIDIGDFILAEGTLFLTKKGEKTLLVENFKLISKSLLPLPEKWHGLKDMEIRYRKRYLDLLSNPLVKDIFTKRSLIIKVIRQFLDHSGFMEVETPILQAIPGGASAKPFITHHNALDIDLYLRIAPELYLKRLIVGGYEKVYELGKSFRNEGIDFSHNPEYTSMEFYWAYADYKMLIEFTEKMFTEIITTVQKTMEVKYGEHTLNFKPPWPRKTFRQLLIDLVKIDIAEISKDDLVEKMKKLTLEFSKKSELVELYEALYKNIILPSIAQPTIIMDYPIEMEPLAKKCEDNPKFVQRFQLVVCGMELLKAYSELNDPIDQKQRFEEQQKLRATGDEEAQRIDDDFVEALEYGMPPCAGEGIGIDRLITILTGSHNLREVILFPTLRPKE